MNTNFNSWKKENNTHLKELYEEYKSDCKLDGVRPDSFNVWAGHRFDSMDF
jgi:hypothetical protein